MRADKKKLAVLNRTELRSLSPAAGRHSAPSELRRPDSEPISVVISAHPDTECRTAYLRKGEHGDVGSVSPGAFARHAESPAREQRCHRHHGSRTRITNRRFIVKSIRTRLRLIARKCRTLSSRQKQTAELPSRRILGASVLQCPHGPQFPLCPYA